MKYQYRQHKNTPNGSMNTILTWIANELAEMNELKKIEMKNGDST